MYFNFSSGGTTLDILMIFVLYLVPILTSYMSTLRGSILGFLATSLESNKSSKRTNPLGKKLSFKLRISGPSSIISSISTLSKLSISTLVNLVHLCTSKIFTSKLFSTLLSIVQLVSILQF